jgi:transcription elongation factor Elf1
MADDSAHLAFMATCPKCNDVRSQAAYGYRTLAELLDDDLPIEVHCRICGQTWAINEQDRARLAKDLAIFG